MNPTAQHCIYDSTTIIILHVSARYLRQNNTLIHINKQHGKYIQQFSVQKTFTKKQQRKKFLQQNAIAEQCVHTLTPPSCSFFSFFFFSFMFRGNTKHKDPGPVYILHSGKQTPLFCSFIVHVFLQTSARVLNFGPRVFRNSRFSGSPSSL